MLKQTKFKKLKVNSDESSSSNSSESDSDSDESSTSEEYFEQTSDWEYEDVRSVGTEKIYKELEDVNNNLINRIEYARE